MSLRHLVSFNVGDIWVFWTLDYLKQWSSLDIWDIGAPQSLGSLGFCGPCDHWAGTLLKLWGSSNNEVLLRCWGPLDIRLPWVLSVI